MGNITARVTESTASEGLVRLTVEYRSGDKVLDTASYQIADSVAAMDALKNDTIKPRLLALASRASVLVGDLLTLNADTGEEVVVEPGIPAARAAQYAAIAALWVQVAGEGASLPATFPIAIALVRAWIAEAIAAENLPLAMARLSVSMELAVMRNAMTEAGCTWSEALAWEAQQA